MSEARADLTAPMSLLDPQALARISSLSLRARTVVEGVLSGIHASPHHGASVEFAEHKEYCAGDEVRLIDWKLYAKSDKLYVKRFEHETNLRATLLVDASLSMTYAGSGVSKWEYARTLAAALAWLLLEQRDAVGVALFSDGLGRFVPPRSDRGHLHAVLHELEAATPAGKGTAARALTELVERLPPRGLVVVITDALEDASALGRALRLMRSRRHDLALLRVLARDELEFPFDDLTHFHSLEDDREILADPRRARQDYLEALAAHERALALECRGHAIDFARFSTADPVDRALLRFLGARAGAQAATRATPV